MAKESFISDFFNFRDQTEHPAYRNALYYIYTLMEKFFQFRTSNNQDREDIVQETILAIHKSRLAAKSEEKFLGFLYAIARYKFIDSLRKKQLYSKTFIHVSEDEDFFDFLTTLTHHSELDLIIMDINSILSPKEKQIFLLSKIQGKSNHIISQELNITVDAVKSIFYRARKKLKEYFK